jgi:hypothetical protein
LAKYVKFYEFEITAYYFAGEDVYQSLANLYGDSSDLAAFKEILGGDYSQLSVKLAPSGRNINSTEWYELTVEPKVNSPGKSFTVRMICRHPKLDKVKDIATNTDVRVQSIVEHILSKRNR